MYFKVCINLCKYFLFTHLDFVVLVNKQYEILIINITFFGHVIIHAYEYFILHYTIISHDNTHINLPKFSLFFLANHAMFTFIIVKLHFVTLSPHNTHITFPNFSLVFFGLIVVNNYGVSTYGS